MRCVTSSDVFGAFSFYVNRKNLFNETEFCV